MIFDNILELAQSQLTSKPGRFKLRNSWKDCIRGCNHNRGYPTTDIGLPESSNIDSRTIIVTIWEWFK